MRVAASLHHGTGGRRRRQIGGHDGGCAAQEREGRFQHARMAHRHQRLQAGRVLQLEHAHRVVAPPPRGIGRVLLPWQRVAHGLAGRQALFERRPRCDKAIDVPADLALAVLWLQAGISHRNPFRPCLVAINES